MEAGSSPSKLGNFLQIRRAILNSGLFDSSFYRRLALDSWVWPSAVLHYLLVGWKRGLNPSHLFDTEFYVNRYRDVRGSDANPLMHYVLHGEQEGRLATQSGAIFRTELHPELAPLPIFAVPGEAGSRLTVVIDDHTPKLLGLGYVPLVALATRVALEADWGLRLLIRSTTIPTAAISDAVKHTMPVKRPLLEIARRVPGHTDDVEALEGEYWWATSISSFESLRSLVPAAQLTWILSANEAARHSAGELRLRVTQALGDRHSSTISLGGLSVTPEGSHISVDSLPALLGVTPSESTPKVLGIVADGTSPESLVSRSVAAIDEAVARGLIDPSEWIPRFIGLDARPITLIGSIVAEQQPCTAPAEWTDALSGADALVVLRAGTEGTWIADEAASAGIPIVDLNAETSAAFSGDIAELAQAISQATSAAAATPVSVTWDSVVTRVLRHMGATA